MLLAVFILGCVSTTKEYCYDITYVVYYPNVTDTVNTVVKGIGVHWGSTKGSNYIVVNGSYTKVYDSSAPFKIIQILEQDCKE